MLNLMNRIFGNPILMDEAGGGDGGGAGSLLAPSGDGGGTSTNSTDGNPGGGTDENGGGAGATGTNSTTQGNTPPDWRSTLPKELQENASLKRYKSVNDLAGAYINAEKLISGDKMAVPNKNWTDADWKNFYAKAGVPEKVEDYKVEFKEGVTIDEDFAKSFRENAHKLGVHPKQAQALADWFSELNTGAETKIAQQQKAEFDKQVSALKQEWGNAFDLNIKRANKLIQDMGAHEHFHKMGYGADPVLMKYLAGVAKDKYSDPKIFEGGGGGGSQRTPAEIDAAIGKLMMSDAYQSGGHPGHKAAVEEMAALHQEKFPTKKS